MPKYKFVSKKPEPKKSLSAKEKKQLFITILCIIAVLVVFFYWLGIHSEREKTRKIQATNKVSFSTKGIITSMHSYKSHSIRVKFIVKGKEFEYDGGWDKNPLHLGVGDSIHLRYAISDPTLAITELEDDF